MQTIEKTNGSALTQPSSSDDLNSVPSEFMGLYQASYQAGFASGRESGYRQGYEAGFWNGRRQGDAGSTAPPAAIGNAAEGIAGTGKARLFGLPCTNCRRLMFSDEIKCPYCKAPRATLVEPPSATVCDPEEARKREPDGGIEPPRISAAVKRIAESGLGRAVGTGLTGVYGGFDGNASATPPMAVRTEEK